MTLQDVEPSRVNGDANYYAGAAKESVGSALGNEQMQANGLALKAKGAAEVTAYKTGQQAEATGERLHGLKDEVVGKVTGDNTQRLGGKAEQQKASLKSEANK